MRNNWGTKPGTLLKNQICFRNSLSGDFVWRLTLTDILSGWTENRATWNKGALGVMAKIEDTLLECGDGFDVG